MSVSLLRRWICSLLSREKDICFSTGYWEDAVNRQKYSYVWKGISISIIECGFHSGMHISTPVLFPLPVLSPSPAFTGHIHRVWKIIHSGFHCYGVIFRIYTVSYVKREGDEFSLTLFACVIDLSTLTLWLHDFCFDEGHKNAGYRKLDPCSIRF